MKANNRLSIKNFGPIKEANIIISSLTVFIGPNSSGKSFSSLLIHSLSNPFKKLGYLDQFQEVRNRSIEQFARNNSPIFAEFKDSLDDYLMSKPKRTDAPFSFPSDKFNIIIQESFGRVYNSMIEEKVKGNFSKDLNKLNRLNKESFSFCYNDNLFVNEDGKLVMKNSSLDITEFPGGDLSKDDDLIFSFKIDDDFISISLNYVLWDNIFENQISLPETVYLVLITKLIGELDNRSYYIPAAGNEILKDVNSYIADDINGILNHSLVQKELLTNFLSVKRDMAEGPFYDLACELENEILGGKIQFKKGEVRDELFFIDDENNLELELNLTSSSIRELMPVIVHLKYFLQERDILIIEEPENHIHPKHQLILVKYLVKAINRNLNIIITTHSDYILEKFNNFIRLGNTNQAVFDKLGYDEANILNYEDVNIYNFKKEDEYCYVCESLDVNFTGFDEDNFSEVISELYDESVDIIDGKIR